MDICRLVHMHGICFLHNETYAYILIRIEAAAEKKVPHNKCNHFKGGGNPPLRNSLKILRGLMWSAIDEVERFSAGQCCQNSRWGLRVFKR